MKKSLLPIIFIGLSLFSCNAQQKQSTFENELDKWKKELYLNGEVGKPCREDNNWLKWQEENPEYYFGLGNIERIETDFNSDGIKDALFYFPAKNCVGGNGTASDFAMLIYSNEDNLLTNKNITKTIENEIKGSLAEKRIYGVYKIIINYKGLGKSLVGKYSAWSEDDPSCCPGSIGTFEYNPIDFSIETQNQTK
ncbi:hypothetical protein [Gillisia sp. Hel1_33_143]|uniref:hypothetical protein n=1 Tax=Gillisia sp. Hel1_33_143 TaxID=1336796 RepID=UPI0012FD7A52|nr:hypothetical protein [Gillisia sp. Hel1_33_143]